jgi:hypothetical protein
LLIIYKSNTYKTPDDAGKIHHILSAGRSAACGLSGESVTGTRFHDTAEADISQRKNQVRSGIAVEPDFPSLRIL